MDNYNNQILATQLDNDVNSFANAYNINNWNKADQDDFQNTYNTYKQGILNGSISLADLQNLKATTKGENAAKYYIQQEASALQQIQQPTIKDSFTKDTLLKGFYNHEFGGSTNPDYQSWLDLDPADKKGNRSTTNRIKELSNYINSIDLNNYDEDFDDLGSKEEVSNKLNRLKIALQDGKLTNEDYLAANALGLNLRDLLSNDLTSSSVTSSNSTSSNTESNSNNESQKSAIQQLQEYMNGGSQEETAQKVLNWNDKIDNTTQLNKPLGNLTDVVNRFKKNGKSGVEYTQYYRYQFYPNFLKQLSTKYTPEYVSQHPDEPIKVSYGTIPLKQYISNNLKLMYDHPNLLNVNDAKMRNMTSDDRMIIPESFNDQDGTIAVYNPNNNQYSRISIKSDKSMLSSYLINHGFGTQSEKNGGVLKFQYGGTSDIQTYLSDDELAKDFDTYGQTPAKNTVQSVNNKSNQLQHNQQSQTGPHKLAGKDSDWKYEDYARIASFLGDVVSLGGFWANVGGSAASLIGDTTADIADDNVSAGQTLSNLGKNIGWTVAGFIPGAKLGKVAKSALKWGPKIMAISQDIGIYNDSNVRNTLNKLFVKGDWSNLNSDDLKNLTTVGRAITGTANAGKSLAREHVINTNNMGAKGVTEIKTNKGTAYVDNNKLAEVNNIAAKNGKEAALKELNDNLITKDGSKYTLQKDEVIDNSFTNNGQSWFGRQARNIGYKPNDLTGKRTFIVTPESQRVIDAVNNYGHLSLLNPLKGYTNPNIINNETKFGLNGTNWFTKGISKVDNALSGKNQIKSAMDKYNSEHPVETPKPEPQPSQEVQQQSEASKPESNQQATQQSPEQSAPVNQTSETSTTQQSEQPTQQVNKRVTINKRYSDQELSSEMSKNAKIPFNDILNNIKQEDYNFLLREDKNKLKQFLTSNRTTIEPKDEKFIRRIYANITLNKTREQKKQELKNIVDKANQQIQQIAKKKNGGIINKFQPGGTFGYNGGINFNSNTSWYNDIFNTYGDYLIDQLKTKGKQFADWTNGMQDSHSNIYIPAKGTDFLNKAYNNEADAVKKYQTEYLTNPLGAPLTNNKGINIGFNTGILNGWNKNRYNMIGTNNRRNLDSVATNFKPDGSYSGETDDRRILGRLGDWANDQLNDYNNRLHSIGWDMYLDTNNNYYKLRPYIKNDGQAVQKPNIQNDTLKSKIKNVTTQVLPKILSSIQAAKDINFNNDNLNKYIKNRVVPHLTTYNTYSPLHGDYYSKVAANNQVAQQLSQASRPFTSNDSLYKLGQLEAQNNGVTIQDKGNLADNQMMLKTQDIATDNINNNLQRATDTINKNNLADAEEANYQNTLEATNRTNNYNIAKDNYYDTILTPLAQKAKEQDAMQKYLDYNVLQGRLNIGSDQSIYQNAQLNKYNQLNEEYQKAIQNGDKAKAQNIANQMTYLIQITQDTVNQRKWTAFMYNLQQLAKDKNLDWSYGPQFTPGMNVPSYQRPSIALNKSGGKVQTITQDMFDEKQKDKDRKLAYKMHRDKLFWAQLRIMHQPDFIRVLK